MSPCNLAFFGRRRSLLFSFPRFELSCFPFCAPPFFFREGIAEEPKHDGGIKPYAKGSGLIENHLNLVPQLTGL